jgi:hypothetical protein
MRATASLPIVSVLSFFAMSSTASSQISWTGPGSEEDPPRACPVGTALNGIRCTGGWCDNVDLKCVPVPSNTTASNRTWTTYFSEEVGGRVCQSQAVPPPNGYITGMECKGGWCDNISLECTAFNNIEFLDCHYTGYVSEEAGGELHFPQGYLAAGARCSGARCDNMRFLICAPTQAIFRAYRGLTPTHGGTWTPSGGTLR